MLKYEKDKNNRSSSAFTCKNFYGLLPNQLRNFCCITGPVLTILLAVVIEVINRQNLGFHGLGTFFFLLILLSIYMGGYRSGMTSSIIASLYTLYYSIYHNLLIYHSFYYFLLSMTSIIIFMGILYIGGKMTTSLNHKKTELHRSQELYRQLVEFSPVGIFMYNDGKFTFCNRTCFKILGISTMEEVLGKPVMNFVHPDYRYILEEWICEMDQHKELMPLMQCKIVRIDKRVVDVEVAALPLHDVNTSSSLGIVRDISECKKTERLQREIMEKDRILTETLELDKIRSDFFANISHEFRTPLNVILSAFKLVKADLESHENKKLNKNVGIIHQNCYRLLRLVNNLIDITKIDSGYFNLELKKGDIVNVVEEITLSVAEYVEDKEISLVFDTDIEEKGMVFDPDVIERIMLNLLSNAVKYTSPGGSIVVNVCDRKEEGVLISVKDNGIGIPEDKQRMIFERFTQADQSLAKQREGSGIGLSLVKSLVKFHNGTISVQSNYGEGSTFLIEIPNIIIQEGDKTNADSLYQNQQNHVERINIEFSDIYHNVNYRQ